MMDKILVIRHRFIGDTLLMLPMLSALRQARPAAHITVLTAPDSVALLAACSDVDERWVFGVRNSVFGVPVQGFWDAVQKARHAGFTTALVLKRSFSSAALPFLAGIPRRIGFATEARQWLLTDALPYLSSQHEADCFLQLLSVYLDQPVPQPVLPKIVFPPDSLTTIQAEWERITSIASVGPRLAFHVGASNGGKQWPLERFSALATIWLARYETGTLHILGGPTDIAAANQVKFALPTPLQIRAVVWAGQSSLLETAWLLQQMTTLVTSDSGLSHVAAAVGTPVRVVFGPTNPLKWHPLGPGHHVIRTETPPPCMPCNLKIRCDRAFSCLTDISAQQVMAYL
jgi:heptosyltransferase II